MKQDKVEKSMTLYPVIQYRILFDFGAQMLSFPHVFSGNPLSRNPHGCPIKAFGHDKFVEVTPFLKSVQY